MGEDLTLYILPPAKDTHVIMKHVQQPAMKLFMLMIHQDKIKLPKQTEFGLKQPLTEDTPSD